MKKLLTANPCLICFVKESTRILGLLTPNDDGGKKTTKQKRFYLSSRASSTEDFGSMIRQHWSIENGCHWVLDTLYREDHSQVKTANAVKNFAILKRMAQNILKTDTTIKKSLPMKRMRAMADEHYRNLLLSLAG